MKKEQKKQFDIELRRKAEKLLEHSKKDFSGESEYMKLIQELSIHQIELELQNEELKEAREAEREIKEKYIQLYDFAPSGYLSLDKEGTITELNQYAAKLLGREKSRLINASFSNFLKSDFKPFFTNFLMNVLNSSFSQTCEVTLERGSHIHLTGLLNNDVVSLTAIDITHLKKVEEEKNRLLEEVTESRKRIDLLLQNARIGSWQWNYKTGQIWIDAPLAEIMGLSRGEKQLALKDFENLLFNEDISNLDNDFKTSIERLIPFESVFRIRGEDEKIKYLNAKAFISYDSEENPKGLTGVCIDITKTQESFEKALIKLNSELTKSNKNLQNFAYVASHDLQEPLRMVTSFIQLLELKYSSKLDETAHEYINFAVQGAKRMYELLNNLLTYSRISTRESSPERVDMNQLLKKVLDNLKIVITEKQVKIESEKLPVIHADESQMIQLLQNLIDNAIKFSKTVPHIRISCNKDGDSYIFKVKDRGIGIEKEYYEKIFRIFQKLHNNLEYSGTGVGLAICKSIVERHGGTIWLESQPGEGSTFYFSIPENPQNTKE